MTINPDFQILWDAVANAESYAAAKAKKAKGGYSIEVFVETLAAELWRSGARIVAAQAPNSSADTPESV